MSRLRFAVVFIGSLIVGGTFVVAGVLKSLDVDGFARDIALHGVIGPGPSAVAARLLVPFEIVVGAAAILGYRRRLALALLIGALLVFIAGTGWAWAQGNTEGCGCFGRFAARTPLSVIVEDLLLIGAGALAFFFAGKPSPGAETIAAAPQGGYARVAGRAGKRGAWKAALIAGIALLSIAFTIASPRLPIDNFATALRPGVELRDLGLAQIAGNLAEGDRLLVILELDEEATMRAIPLLNTLAEQPGVPPITGLTAATAEKRAEFFFTHAPDFEMIDVPVTDLRRLYRRAPRAFRVHNGRVSQVWTGIPPAEEFAR